MSIVLMDLCAKLWHGRKVLAPYLIELWSNDRTELFTLLYLYHMIGHHTLLSTINIILVYHMHLENVFIIYSTLCHSKPA